MRTIVAARNLAKTWLIATAVVAVFAFVGWALDGVRLLSIFVFCALLLVGGAYWTFDRVVLGMVGARELPLAEAPLLHSTVERLAAVAGVAKPKLHLIPDGPPLALATGRGVRSSSLALTASCIGACTPAELEGVLAHELAHIRLHDVQVQTSAVVLAGTLLEASRLGGMLERALLFLLGPVAAACVHLVLSPKREFEADAYAARLTGSPHGLADALIRMEQAAELVDFAGSPATEPLYTVNPFLERGLAALFVTHPPVAERVRRLRDNDPVWRERLRDEAAA